MGMSTRGSQMTALGKLWTPVGCIRNTDEGKDCNNCCELFAQSTDNLDKSCFSFPSVRAKDTKSVDILVCQADISKRTMEKLATAVNQDVSCILVFVKPPGLISHHVRL